MKKTIIIQIMTVFLALPLLANASVKVGIVNVPRAMQGINKVKSINTKLENELKAKEKVLKTKQAALMKSEAEFRKKAAVLSDEAKKKKGMELQRQFMELQKLAQTNQRAFEKRRVDLTKPVMEGIKKILPSLSKKHKVDMIVQQPSGLLFAANQIDLTDELVKAMNK